jgi:hypothetical protein
MVIIFCRHFRTDRLTHDMLHNNLKELCSKQAVVSRWWQTRIYRNYLIKPSVPIAEVQGPYVNVTTVIYNVLPCTWAVSWVGCIIVTSQWIEWQPVASNKIMTIYIYLIYHIVQSIILNVFHCVLFFSNNTVAFVLKYGHLLCETGILPPHPSICREWSSSHIQLYPINFSIYIYGHLWSIYTATSSFIDIN